MRNTLFIGLAAAFLSFSFTLSAKTPASSIPAQHTTEDPAVQFLRKFYQDYFTAFLLEDLKQSEQKQEALRKQYCSPELLAKLKSAELDYDVFLNAQDANDSAASTLQIHKNDGSGRYVVYYNSGWSNEIIQIDVTVKSTDGKWLITSIGKL